MDSSEIRNRRKYLAGCLRRTSCTQLMLISTLDEAEGREETSGRADPTTQTAFVTPDPLHGGVDTKSRLQPFDHRFHPKSPDLAMPTIPASSGVRSTLEAETSTRGGDIASEH